MYPQPEGPGAWPAPLAGGSLAFLSPGWPAGSVPNGIVSYVASLRRGLADAAVRSFVLCHAGGDGDPDVVRLARLPGAMPAVPRRVWSLARTVAPIGTAGIEVALAVLREVRRLARDERLRLLEIEDSFGWARWIAPRSPVPVVVRLHGPWFLNGRANGAADDAAFRRRDRLERRGLLAAAGVTAPSAEVLERVRRHHGIALPDAAVVPNPVMPSAPADRWRLDAAEPGRVLFVGRFDRHKGGAVMLDAFAQVAARVPDARLAFIGPDGGVVDAAGKRWQIEEYVRDRMGANAGRVEWLGPCPHADIDRWRRRARVTVVASAYEVAPYTALEALAAGSPTVMSDAGGLPELATDGRTALFFPVGDADALAERLVALLDDGALARRLGAAAWDDCAARFAPDVVARRALDVYARVADVR